MRTIIFLSDKQNCSGCKTWGSVGHCRTNSGWLQRCWSMTVVFFCIWKQVGRCQHKDSILHSRLVISYDMRLTLLWPKHLKFSTKEPWICFLVRKKQICILWVQTFRKTLDQILCSHPLSAEHGESNCFDQGVAIIQGGKICGKMLLEIPLLAGCTRDHWMINTWEETIQTLFFFRNLIDLRSCLGCYGCYVH